MSALIAYCDRDSFTGVIVVLRRDRRAGFGASGAGSSAQDNCAAVASCVHDSGLPNSCTHQVLEPMRCVTCPTIALRLFLLTLTQVPAGNGSSASADSGSVRVVSAVAGSLPLVTASVAAVSSASTCSVVGARLTFHLIRNRPSSRSVMP